MHNRHWIHAVIAGLALAAAVPVTTAVAQENEKDPRPAPPRAEGEGPFERLIIRNATVIDGTGAPPRGPVDIVVEGNRIKSLFSVDAAADCAAAAALSAASFDAAAAASAAAFVAAAAASAAFCASTFALSRGCAGRAGTIAVP